MAMVALCLGQSAWADGTNVLTNPSLPTSNPHQVPGWVFSTWIFKDNPGAVGQVGGKIAVDTDGKNMLTVASTQSLANIQLWWQTLAPLPCAGGSTYELSGVVKGAIKSGTARPTIGVYFMDATGKWLGFQALPSDAVQADWQKFDGKVTVPENAATMGVRLGVVYSDGDAEISFKEPTLQRAGP